MATYYSDAFMDAQVDSASPLQLIHMAYEMAIQGVQDAREHLKNGQIAERAHDITRVTAILLELGAALDHKAAPEMSLQLARLYDYMIDRLREANYKQSEEPLIEVEGLLRSIGESWTKLASDETHTDGVPETIPAPESLPVERGPWEQPSEDRSYGSGYTL
jgi:flagellar protein FliS